MKYSPFSGWLELARMGAEIWMASAEVVPRRLARMAVTRSPPSARDRGEFQRMGQEKIDASIAALTATAFALASSAPQWLLRQARTACAMNPALARGVTGKPHSRRSLATLASKTTKACAGDAKSATKIVKVALAPIHRRVTANARRLRKG